MASLPEWNSFAGILTFLLSLLGRIFSSGLEALSLSLAGGWATVLPTVVGYGLGLYLTWVFFADLNDELNPLIGIIGTILLGGVCLWLLQPLMIMVTGLFHQVLGTVAAGSALFISFPLSLLSAFIKHLVQNRAEAMVKRKLEGASTLPEPNSATPQTNGKQTSSP
jgi:hypothetical protein